MILVAFAFVPYHTYYHYTLSSATGHIFTGQRKEYGDPFLLKTK